MEEQEAGEILRNCHKYVDEATLLRIYIDTSRKHRDLSQVMKETEEMCKAEYQKNHKDGKRIELKMVDDRGMPV